MSGTHPIQEVASIVWASPAALVTQVLPPTPYPGPIGGTVTQDFDGTPDSETAKSSVIFVIFGQGGSLDWATLAKDSVTQHGGNPGTGAPNSLGATSDGSSFFGVSAVNLFKVDKTGSALFNHDFDLTGGTAFGDYLSAGVGIAAGGGRVATPVYGARFAQPDFYGAILCDGGSGTQSLMGVSVPSPPGANDNIPYTSAAIGGNFLLAGLGFGEDDTGTVVTAPGSSSVTVLPGTGPIGGDLNVPINTDGTAYYVAASTTGANSFDTAYRVSAAGNVVWSSAQGSVISALAVVSGKLYLSGPTLNAALNVANGVNLGPGLGAGITSFFNVSPTLVAFATANGVGVRNVTRIFWQVTGLTYTPSAIAAA